MVDSKTWDFILSQIHFFELGSGHGADKTIVMPL